MTPPMLPPISPASALGMLLAALVMVLTPGPNMVYLLSRSISHGRRAGLISLAGTGVGFLTYLLLAACGLAVVLVAVPPLFIALKAAGVLYLAWLTWQALRPGGRSMLEVRDLPAESASRLFRWGLVTNLLNPKTAIMYLTLIPQFIDPARGHELVQGATLGLLQIGVSLSVNALVVVGAGALAGALVQHPRWLAVQRRLTGGLLGVVTVLLAPEVPARARI